MHHFPTFELLQFCAKLESYVHLAYVNSGKYAQLLQNKWLTYMVMHIHILIDCL